MTIVKFEKMVRKKKNLKAMLSAETNALVGLEYLIAIDDLAQAYYVCALCDKRGIWSNIMNHFTSPKHRSSFLVTSVVH